VTDNRLAVHQEGDPPLSRRAHDGPHGSRVLRPDALGRGVRSWVGVRAGLRRERTDGSRAGATREARPSNGRSGSATSARGRRRCRSTGGTERRRHRDNGPRGGRALGGAGPPGRRYSAACRMRSSSMPTALSWSCRRLWRLATGKPPREEELPARGSHAVDRRCINKKTLRVAGLSKRLMGLEPTTFCMASSGEDPLSQQECGVSAVADAVGLPSINGDSDTIWTLAAQRASGSLLSLLRA
jgi:hypothetical protein